MMLQMKGNKRSALYSFEYKEKPDFFKFVAIPHVDASLLEGLNIYASTNGVVPTVEEHQFNSEPLWNGGEGLFMEGS
jgi:hypothetical protein